MMSNKIVDQIYSKKNLKYNVEKINFIKEEIQDNDDLEKIMIAILLIETYYRKIYFRMLEYLVVFFNSILNIIFKIELKNFTIGSFQIGLSYILNYNGRDIYPNCKKIDVIDILDLKNILNAYKFENNFKVTLDRVEKLYNKYVRLDKKLVYRRVGERYNGEYAYGVLVEKLVKRL